MNKVFILCVVVGGLIGSISADLSPEDKQIISRLTNRRIEMSFDEVRELLNTLRAHNSGELPEIGDSGEFLDESRISSGRCSEPRMSDVNYDWWQIKTGGTGDWVTVSPIEKFEEHVMRMQIKICADNFDKKFQTEINTVTAETMKVAKELLEFLASAKSNGHANRGIDRAKEVVKAYVDKRTSSSNASKRERYEVAIQATCNELEGKFLKWAEFGGKAHQIEIPSYEFEEGSDKHLVFNLITGFCWPYRWIGLDYKYFAKEGDLIRPGQQHIKGHNGAGISSGGWFSKI